MSAETLSRCRSSRRASVFFILLLFISLTVPVVSAAGDEVTSSYLPAEYIQSIIDNTPATNPALFDQMRSNQSIIMISGTIPALPQGEESYRWGLVLQEILKSINNDGLLTAYHKDNGGFIIGYGSQENYIIISVHADSEVTDEELNQIIKVIQSAGENAGIADLPIVIEKSTPAQGYAPAASSGPAETKTIPGVGLGISALLVVAVVLSARKFKK
ncbi:hypothetical protein MmiHf6_00720 [Methanimicrococcus hongohii]|uniref:Uncharacterized protein n=1 Tax=Methanimicrococcus hongohii TaxID=3028295 RepID=A0AA96V962_9EURY|nr:hypothetical protein [Methanimicrococcus sp. Hf6]WNY22787.1 hypothetical protein MmiHf6_00720 [Methanimicrococcus sp. Hf6]